MSRSYRTSIGSLRSKLLHFDQKEYWGPEEIVEYKESKDFCNSNNIANIPSLEEFLPFLHYKELHP